MTTMSEYEEKVREDDVYAAELLRRQHVDSLYARLNVPRDRRALREAEEAELEEEEAELRALVDATVERTQYGREGEKEKARAELSELRCRCDELRKRREWRGLDDEELIARRVKKAYNHLVKHFHDDKRRNPRARARAARRRQGSNPESRAAAAAAAVEPPADSATFAELTRAKK